jgi:Family of unknown function (DUF6477)
MKFSLPEEGPAHPFASIPGLEEEVACSLAKTIKTGAEEYARERHLPRLIPLTPREVADTRPEARRAILARLARALRAERNRGRAGHWTYDLNRHIGLKQAYLAERRALGHARPQAAPGE